MLNADATKISLPSYGGFNGTGQFGFDPILRTIGRCMGYSFSGVEFQCPQETCGGERYGTAFGAEKV
jgi:hypothetical protein